MCPTCGDGQLTETPLDDVGTLCTYTAVHVASPAFEPGTPYITAIASFGDVRVTGVLMDVDADDAAIGMDVRLECAEYEDNRLLALSPA